jgi:NADH-quinone oxidoreductase subunit L
MVLIVSPINAISNFSRKTIEPQLSKLVFSFGSAAKALSSQGRKVHNGNIGLYLFMFVLGICALIIYLFIAQ